MFRTVVVDAHGSPLQLVYLRASAMRATAAAVHGLTVTRDLGLDSYITAQQTMLSIAVQTTGAVALACQRARRRPGSILGRRLRPDRRWTDPVAVAKARTEVLPLVGDALGQIAATLAGFRATVADDTSPLAASARRQSQRMAVTLTTELQELIRLLTPAVERDLPSAEDRS